MSQNQLANLTNKLNEVLRRVVDVQAGTVVAGPMLTVELDAGRGRVLQPSTVTKVAVGDRVWLLRLGVFSLILGVAGGRPEPVIISGLFSLTSLGGNANGSIPRSFTDDGTSGGVPIVFREPPLVTATCQSSTRVNTVTADVTEAGFTCLYREVTGTAVSSPVFRWTAIGVPA